MNALLPALCGTLLLATSIPAAAAQAKVNDLGSKQRELTGQASRVGNGERQLPDRKIFSSVDAVSGRQSTTQFGANGRPYAGSRGSTNALDRTSTIRSMDWNSHGSTIGRPTPKR